jgi:hypothetical protein
MASYKNISNKTLSLIYKGRKIKVNPGQVIEGPETFNMYKDLKKVDEVEVNRYQKAVSKVMRYNPTEAKKLNLNVETFTKVNNVSEHQPLKTNTDEIKKLIDYIDTLNKNTKPSVAIILNGNSIKYNNKLEEIKQNTTYEQVTFHNNKDPNSLNNDFIIGVDIDSTISFDFISYIVKFGMVSSVNLPKPFNIKSISKEWIKKEIKTKYTKTKSVYMSIGTLSHNERKYKDFLNDLTKQKTNIKMEVIVAPNYTNIYSSCSEALNILKFLSNGQIINLCHQDLRCQPYWIQNIITHTKQLDARKIKWGVLGMAGAFISNNPQNEYNVLYLGDGQSGRSFSNVFRKMYGSRKEVQCVDELSLIIKKQDDIYFDEETFNHYHYYGADLCLQYLDKGYKNFAIDAECVHLSDGQSNLDAHKNEFIENSIKLYKKWSDKFQCFKTTTANFRPDQGLIVLLIFVLINSKRKNKDLPQVIHVK